MVSIELCPIELQKSEKTRCRQLNSWGTGPFCRPPGPLRRRRRQTGRRRRPWAWGNRRPTADSSPRSWWQMAGRELPAGGRDERYGWLNDFYKPAITILVYAKMVERLLLEDETWKQPSPDSQALADGFDSGGFYPSHTRPVRNSGLWHNKDEFMVLWIL